MKCLFPACVTLFLVTGCFSLSYAQTQSPQEVNFQLMQDFGDRFYDTREVPGNILRSVEFYKKALKIHPKSGDIAWKIARSLCGIDRHTTIPETRIEWLEQGISFAEQAVEWAPANIRSHFWLGACYAEYGSAAGLWKAWHYIYPVRREMRLVLEKDPKFAGAYHVLGAWYFTVPFWLGGSRDKGIELLYQAVAYQPDYTPHFIRLAQYLLQEKRTSAAIQILKQVLQVEQPYHPALASEDFEYARELLSLHQQSSTP
ncbi:MAG: hypothetical protein HQM11_14320 [SAR324 cluster bacterium]|nr:hypothetical protein [SAR324 cluster bacterium]